MDKKRSKNIAVVTGGSSGIGERTCQMMLADGYQVISVSLDNMAWTHEQLTSITVDLRDADATRNAALQIANEFKVTHFVHNAGMILPNLVGDADPNDLQTLTQLHAGAALILLQAFLPSLESCGHGRVVFNASRAALGAETRTAYSYSKAGLLGMARTWALELGPAGVTVNVVSPGPVLTDNFWDIIGKGSDREQKIANSLPVRRLGTVEDVARAIMFFADTENAYITGQTLYVCGGASIGGVNL